MEIRAAVPADIDIVVELGLEGLNNDPYPNLLIDKAKVRKVVTECISSARDFCWVAEHEGVVVAVVSAFVHELMFYERKQATVFQFWSRKPRAGVKLIRKFLEWARSRPIIKLIVFTLECHADPRIGKLLIREGLKVELPVYMELR